MEIRIKNLNKTINNEQILKNISLTINSGDIFALIGPNGAGKTTLIRILLNLYKITNGEVYIDNIDVNSNDFQNVKCKIGFLLHNLGLFKDLSAWDNLGVFLQGIFSQSNSNRTS